MTDTLIDVADFRAAAKRGRPKADAHVYRVTAGKPKALEDGSRGIRFCFSDGSVDRVGDTIDPKGWRLTTFNANPVALWAHDSSAPPIGRASQVMVEDSRLMGTIEFATPDIYEFADTIYKLTKAGFLNAVSVGFIPLEYSFSDEDGREWGLDFEVQELLEISVCPVPANANALVEARAKGIDTRPLVEWAERTLAGGGKVILPKSELERLRKAAKEPPTTGRHRRRSGGMEETDPASGGAVVATCARGADEECGMANPQECSIHMTKETPEDEAKRIAGIVRRTIREELRNSSPLATRRRSVRPRRRAEGDESGDGSDSNMSPEHEACIRSIAEHLDAMGDAMDEASDHHEKAMDLVNSVCDDLDTDPENETGSDSSSADGKSMQRRLREARRLLARHTEV